MHIFTQKVLLQTYLQAQRSTGRRYGFVPTMGALHPGHLSLIGQSQAENDFTVVSIYVNPAQFNNPDDFAKYPRTLASDEAMLREAGCEVLFAPTDAEMYPEPPQLKLHFGSLEEVMEGKHRPGHFNGVGLVVAKLFHMVQPDAAYFGQKDLQQFLIINQLVKDLSFPLRLVRCPTVREADGLAMSSRNRRLEPEQRQIALIVPWALKEAEEFLLATREVQGAKELVHRLFEPIEGVFLEYFTIADAVTLHEVQSITGYDSIALCIAAFIGDIRLIDNMIMDKEAWQ